MEWDMISTKYLKHLCIFFLKYDEFSIQLRLSAASLGTKSIGIAHIISL